MKILSVLITLSSLTISPFSSAEVSWEGAKPHNFLGGLTLVSTLAEIAQKILTADSDSDKIKTEAQRRDNLLNEFIGTKKSEEVLQQEKRDRIKAIKTTIAQIYYHITGDNQSVLKDLLSELDRLINESPLDLEDEQDSDIAIYRELKPGEFIKSKGNAAWMPSILLVTGEAGSSNNSREHGDEETAPENGNNHQGIAEKLLCLIPHAPEGEIINLIQRQGEKTVQLVTHQHAFAHQVTSKLSFLAVCGHSIHKAMQWRRGSITAEQCGISVASNAAACYVSSIAAGASYNCVASFLAATVPTMAGVSTGGASASGVAVIVMAAPVIAPATVALVVGAGVSVLAHMGVHTIIEKFGK